VRCPESLEPEFSGDVPRGARKGNNIGDPQWGRSKNRLQRLFWREVSPRVLKWKRAGSTRGENHKSCKVVGAKDAEWASTLVGRFRMHERRRRYATVTSFGFGLSHRTRRSQSAESCDWSNSIAVLVTASARRCGCSSQDEYSSYQPQGEIVATLG